MHILRIVDSKGNGVYRGLWQNTVGCPDESEYHPLPEDDNGIMRYFDSELELDVYIRTHLFGFGNPEQMICWVYDDDWWRMLGEGGGKVRILKVSDCIIGDSQVMFNPHKSEVVTEISCSEFTRSQTWDILDDFKWVAD